MPAPIQRTRAHAAGARAQVVGRLKQSLVTALTHAPAVVLVDDVDCLLPVIPEHAPPSEQHALEYVNELLAQILDWLREQARLLHTELDLRAHARVHARARAPRVWRRVSEPFNGVRSWRAELQPCHDIPAQVPGASFGDLGVRGGAMGA